MRRNYYRKFSASIYHHAKNVGIIRKLAYPKIFLSMNFRVVHTLTKLDAKKSFFTCSMNHEFKLFLDRFDIYVQSAKILLLPPKYEIIMVPSNHSFFQYWIAILDFSH